MSLWTGTARSWACDSFQPLIPWSSRNKVSAKTGGQPGDIGCLRVTRAAVSFLLATDPTPVWVPPWDLTGKQQGEKQQALAGNRKLDAWGAGGTDSSPPHSAPPGPLLTWTRSELKCPTSTRTLGVPLFVGSITNADV